MNEQKVTSLPFLRTLVVVNGLVPLAMLAWDAWRGQLGSNAVNNALHITGMVSLVFLVLSLLMTPLRWWTGWGAGSPFGGHLGFTGFFMRWFTWRFMSGSIVR